MRALILIAASVATGIALVPETAAQDGSMSWIDAARNAPSMSAPAVPVPDRRPRPPKRSATRASASNAAAAPPPRAERKPEAVQAPAEPEPATQPASSVAQAPAPADSVETGATFAHEAVAARALGRDVAVRKAKPEPAPVAENAPADEAAPETTGSTPRAERAAVPATPPPARKPARPKQAAVPVPPQAAAQQKKRPGQASAQDKKCEALGRCRDAFARCKAQFIKENGKWDLEKEPCGAEYKVCIRKTFAPGEMFFTRWFWPYEACP